MSDKDGFTPEDLARIVRWVILIFFFFLIVSNIPQFGLGPSKPAVAPDAPNPNLAASQAEPNKDCTGDIFTNFSKFSIPLFPVQSAAIGVTDIKKGAGEPASCGQRATLRYTYATRGGDVIFSNMNQGDPTKDVLIGGNEMLPGFERGLITMQAGGERDISIPPALGFSAVAKNQLRDHTKFKFSDTSSTLTARASLLSLSPALPQSELKLRVVEQMLGDGTPVECGDKVYVKLTLWKMDGTSLYSNDKDSEPLAFTAGTSQMPYGIEEGVIGMMPHGKRTLIIPPAFMKPLIGDAAEQKLEGVKIPEGEIILAVVETLPAPKAAPAAPANDAPPKEPTEEK